MKLYSSELNNPIIYQQYLSWSFPNHYHKDDITSGPAAPTKLSKWEISERRAGAGAAHTHRVQSTVSSSSVPVWVVSCWRHRDLSSRLKTITRAEFCVRLQQHLLSPQTTHTQNSGLKSVIGSGYVMWHTPANSKLCSFQYSYSVPVGVIQTHTEFWSWQWQPRLSTSARLW